VKVTGRVSGRIRHDFADRVHAAVADALEEVCEVALAEANESVPIEEGTLQASGFAEVDRETLEGQVGYDTVYAARQHEEVTWRHDPGRRAKWLELTVEENRDRYEQHIAGKVRDALDKP
jgi:hypothetical protein